MFILTSVTFQNNIEKMCFYFFASLKHYFNIIILCYFKRGFLSRFCIQSSRYEWFVFVCVTDKLFGQCWSSRHDQVQYQVSVPVLQRLQEVLKELMIQGKHTHTHTHICSCNAIIFVLFIF